MKHTTNIWLVMMTVILMGVTGCQRYPILHLHEENHITIGIPVVDLNVNIFWEYGLGISMEDWNLSWHYGWDNLDEQYFGELLYNEPNAFEIRRYFTGEDSVAVHTSVIQNQMTGHKFTAYYDFGYYDIMVWNQIQTIDGVQSINFDETSTLEYVTAYTNQSLVASHAPQKAPGSSHAYYQPEGLFAGSFDNLYVSQNPNDYDYYDRESDTYFKYVDIEMKPLTYIYLTQIILHHNNGRVSGVTGESQLTGMAQSVNLKTGVSGSDPISVYYNTRLKRDIDVEGEKVDIIGGRLFTFGICGINPHKVVVTRGESGESGENTESSETVVDMNNLTNDAERHLLDVTMVFNNGLDSIVQFDVTDQIRKYYRGGVITLELDMDTVVIPSRSSSGLFDVIVADPDSATYEFEM